MNTQSRYGGLFKSPHIQIVLFAMLGVVNTSFAHHSIAPHFDTDVELVLEGVVTEWIFSNPHAYVHFDVADAQGEIANWRCETRSSTMLRRTGFSETTLQPGESVTIKGNPARRDTNHCSITDFVFSGGEEVNRFGTLPENRYTNAETIELQDVRPRILENGQPNISGQWTPAPRTRSQYHLTDAGQAEMDKYEQIYEDPSLACDIGNIFFGWNRSGLTNIVTQYDDRIEILFGYMDFERVIYLDKAEHPDDIVPGRGGHAIGHWEGNTLLVDAIGHSKGVLHPLSGVPNSTQMHTVERFWYDAETETLNHSYTIEDPLYLAESYMGQDSMVTSTIPYEPYDCVELSGENNRRP